MGTLIRWISMNYHLVFSVYFICLLLSLLKFTTGRWWANEADLHMYNITEISERSFTLKTESWNQSTIYNMDHYFSASDLTLCTEYFWKRRHFKTWRHKFSGIWQCVAGQALLTHLHNVTPQMTCIFSNTTMRISHLTLRIFIPANLILNKFLSHPDNFGDIHSLDV